MTHFFQTRMGQKFYEHDVPYIADSLHKIFVELQRANDLKEKELNLKDKKGE